MSYEPRKRQVWYRLGYALERGRQATAEGGSTALGATRIPSTPRSERGSLNPFLEVGAGWLERQFAVGVQRALGGRARTPWLGAIAGAAVELAGAAVLGLARAERGVRDDESGAERAPGGDEDSLPDHLPPRPALLIPDPLGVAARGAAHGLIYGGLVSSARLPAWSKGLGYGVARYLASEGGGVAHLLGPISPHRAVPLLHTMVADEDRDEGLISHLVAGVALAMIYESSPVSSGTTRGSEGDDEG